MPHQQFCWLGNLIMKREERGVSSHETHLAQLPSLMKPNEIYTENVIVSLHDTFDHNSMQKLNVIGCLWNCAMRVTVSWHDNLGNSAMKPYTEIGLTISSFLLNTGELCESSCFIALKESIPVSAQTES